MNTRQRRTTLATTSVLNITIDNTPPRIPVRRRTGLPRDAPLPIRGVVKEAFALTQRLLSQLPSCLSCDAVRVTVPA